MKRGALGVLVIVALVLSVAYLINFQITGDVITGNVVGSGYNKIGNGNLNSLFTSNANGDTEIPLDPASNVVPTLIPAQVYSSPYSYAIQFTNGALSGKSFYILEAGSKDFGSSIGDSIFVKLNESVSGILAPEVVYEDGMAFDVYSKTPVATTPPTIAITSPLTTSVANKQTFGFVDIEFTATNAQKMELVLITHNFSISQSVCVANGWQWNTELNPDGCSIELCRLGSPASTGSARYVDISAYAVAGQANKYTYKCDWSQKNVLSGDYGVTVGVLNDSNNNNFLYDLGEYAYDWQGNAVNVKGPSTMIIKPLTEDPTEFNLRSNETRQLEVEFRAYNADKVAIGVSNGTGTVLCHTNEFFPRGSNQSLVSLSNTSVFRSKPNNVYEFDCKFGNKSVSRGDYGLVLISVKDLNSDADYSDFAESYFDSELNSIELISSTSGGNTTANCGNGIRESGEQCDRSDLGTTTCKSLNYDSGTLACNNQCKFDVTLCKKDVLPPPVECTTDDDCEDGFECDASNNCVEVKGEGNLLWLWVLLIVLLLILIGFVLFYIVRNSKSGKSSSNKPVSPPRPSGPSPSTMQMNRLPGQNPSYPFR